ncbi:MAG TPA: transketolase [Geminicoccaceae bacterium]|nr:transketolase [Geminicoccus sp.]HMU52455.1 transketolase [Geminicoccaceae bacterium]
MDRLTMLGQIEKKLLWLASWTIHNANHVRPSRDKLKVGGHQASCASVATIMTALWFDVLRPGDRVAVKPHASPIYHAAQYLLDLEPVERLQRFRALGGAQSYPSRTKDHPGVDFSTGSVGLGAAMTLFASLAQDYVRLHGLSDPAAPAGRMISIVGDAELDEGNIYEALLEGWKYDVRNLWWIIDYNRQSLDRVVPERLFEKIQQFFAAVGWQVVTLKYGKLLQAAFARPGGEALQAWIDGCPNDLYSALTFKGGAAWRSHLESDLGRNPAIRQILDSHDDDALARLMTNLGGHDLGAVIDAFHDVADDRPHCFIAYTVKGWGLPFAGHKDNHAGLMNPEQMAELQRAMGVPAGEEWSRHAGLDVSPARLDAFLAEVPWRNRQPKLAAETLPVPAELPAGRAAGRSSTQEAFGRLMGELARSELPLAGRLVTTSPDVTVSTNLGAWVSRRGVFNRRDHEDVFRAQAVASPTVWRESGSGQHVELGIAENNLFLNLAALGLAHELFGARLLPVGTLYDPFINRGLDALIYACYQGARFLLVATPSGTTLAPEGGAHQSIGTPLVGISQPGLTLFEPAFADELAVVMRWALGHMQAEEGGSVYLRLTTRQIDQPQRPIEPGLADAMLAGGYWLKQPEQGGELAIAFCGAVAPEVLEAAEAMADDLPGLGILNIVSADRLHADWRRRTHISHAATLLQPLAVDAAIVTVCDGHPLTLSWLGAVRGQRVAALGVEAFGQSADIPDLFGVMRLDAPAIVDACAAVLLRR